MMRNAVVICLVLVGCASSRRGGEAVDADPGGDLDAPPDQTPVDAMIDAKLNGFGDPCTDTDQCESHLCIAAGSGGVCSQLCGSCPPGWGCFGVLGAIDPGQVAFVCVPTSNQLCSPCQSDTECTLIGMDKCVTEDTGRKYCGRDCSTVSCPTGYDCTVENIGGTDYHECTPHSGACDCNDAAQQGMTDACSITTLLGTACAGTSTCAGASGWGTCQPPATTDTPDGNYVDDNCDGIDGEYDRGIFVAGGGTNSSTCGLTHTTPCATISFGIVRGVQTGRPNVYVQAGTYNEVVVLLNGVNVWGGYDFQWKRGAYSDMAHRVLITGGQDTTTGGDGEYMTVRAHDLIVPVTMADLVLQGPTAQGVGGASGRDGRSSYVVHAKAASVTLSRVQIVAGNGATGATGSNGTDAVSVDANGNMGGGGGGNGDEKTDCDSSSRGGGGGAGTNSCAGSPSSRDPNAGGGGRGGTMDTSCGVFSLDLDARAGDPGGNAIYVNGVFGLHGNGGSGSGNCGPTSDGNQGFIQNGSSGTRVDNGYLGGINSLYWYAHAGTGGGTGENGGGGGGGGGGGCDSGQDAYGAGGGGGGAGGCAARGGGGGGGGGGGSFGIMAVGTSTVMVDSCTLVRGAAGSGGAGGTGGRGQSGGGRGFGGSFHPGSATPGNGGNGAHGGHGGGGAGGQGGRSVGVLTSSDSAVQGTCTTSQGSAGLGGSGGQSAPNAPATERDGNNGQTGSTGSLDTTKVCASSASC